MSVSSSFLTGVGTGLGQSLVGSFGGDGVNTARGQSSWAADLQGRVNRRSMRHYRRHLEKLPSAMVKGTTSAGLHPLAALGMQQGSGPAFSVGTPGIPGQNSTGSAVGEGILAGIGAYNLKQSRQHQEKMGGLQLKEQELRNEWVREQIKNSQLRRAEILANATRSSGEGTPGPGPQQAGAVKFSDQVSVPTGTTTSSQDAEDRYWEIGGAGMGLHNIGYDIAGAYLGSVGDSIRRLENTGSIPPPLTYSVARPSYDGKNYQSVLDKYRWRNSKKYGEYRLVRPPESRPSRYSRSRDRSRAYDYMEISP